MHPGPTIAHVPHFAESGDVQSTGESDFAHEHSLCFKTGFGVDSSISAQRTTKKDLHLTCAGRGF